MTLNESGRHGLHDVDDAAVATLSEGNRTGLEGEDGVIFANAGVTSGMEVCAALTDNDLASIDEFATETLHAQALSVRIATVAGRTEALFMCHVSGAFSLRTTRNSIDQWDRSGDLGDLDDRLLLPVTLTLTVASLVLEFDDGDLRTFGRVDDLSLNGDL